MSQPGARGVPVPLGMLAPSGTRVIISTPQAMPVSMTPAWIRPATRWVDCWAEEHWASMVVPAVCWGSPASNQARRTSALDCSPACVTQPPMTCSTSSAGTPERSISAR